MSIRRLVAIADGGPGDARTLAAAARLCVDLEASARVLPAYPDPSADLVSVGLSLGAPVLDSTFTLLKDAERKLQARIHEACRAAAEQAGTPFQTGEGGAGLTLAPRELQPGQALATELVLADLLVAGHAAMSASPFVSGLVTDALLHGRVGVLVARGEPERLSGRVAVAWDGSPQAGRALRAALPLLAKAADVILLQSPTGLAREQKPAAHLDRLADYLAAHGVTRVTPAVVEEGREGPALMAEAARQGAGLFVAGAYGHSRLQQAVFGGATRAFLHGEDGPSLLLAH